MTNITTTEITLAGGLPARIARPANMDRPAPGIVLMHERYGLVQHTLDLGERFAAEGYVCITPDCFFRHPDQDALHAGDARYNITDDEAAEHLGAAFDHLAAMDDVLADCIAVKGVCQTGRHPLVLASRRKIAAALVWYGAAQDREWEVTELYHEKLADMIAKIDCPVFGAFGEADHMISLDHVKHLRDCLEEKGKSYEIHVYKGAPHGWLNDTMPGRYRAAQAEAGLAAEFAFLRNVLSPAWDHSTISWRFNCDSGADYDFSKNVRME